MTNDVVIKPSGVPPRFRAAAFEGASIDAMVADQLLVWSPDSAFRSRREPVRAPLPGTGEGAITEVVRASYCAGEPALYPLVQERLLFIDEAGRCRWRSKALPKGGLDVVWPENKLRDLEHVGIAVSTRAWRRSVDMNQDYPGSAEIMQWFCHPKVDRLAAVVAGLILVIVVIWAYLTV